MAFQHRLRTVSLCAIALVASAWACTADDPPAPVQTTPAANACTEPRPQMCPMIYMPVCGIAKDGSEKTYPNSCIACRDASVMHSTPGKCAKG